MPAARIYSVEDIFNDPHYRAREMLVEVEDPVLGPVAVTGIVPKLSGSPGAIRWAGRDIGSDTNEIMQTELSLEAVEIERLAQEGIIFSADLPAGDDG